MQDKAYPIPTRIRLNRLWLRPLIKGLFYILGRIKIIGRENIPATGPYVVAINHLSIFDPPLVLACWPFAMEAIGAVEIWRRRGQSTLVRLYGTIQVRRSEYDRQVIETMLVVLRSGGCLMIAPEGGRSHVPGLQRGKPGLAYIVEKTRVPVLPVGIVGTTDDFLEKALHARRPPIEMRIGKATRLPPVTGKGHEKHASLQRNVDQIMYAIAELLPPEYRGIYAGSTLDTAEPN